MLKLLRLAGTVLSAAVLVVTVGIALATIVVPKLLGAAPYTVLTGSMRPTMAPGALAIVAPLDAADIRIGDVITYQLTPGEPEVVTHRVVGINAASDGGRTYVTQGDANTSPDAEPVIEAQIRGKVAYSVPLMGHVNSALNSKTRSNALVLGAGALIVYGVWQIGSEVRSKHQRTERPAAS